MSAERAVDIQHAASQAWIGFWQTCMADAGAQSLLQYDETSVRGALHGGPLDDLVPVPVIAPPPPVVVLAPSDLAQRLEGDARISGITIRDVLVGLEDYFTIFRKMRRYHPSAYSYFRRVGAPLCLDKTAIWRSAIEDHMKPIVNSADLPAFIGIFFGRAKEEARQSIINDDPTLMDFQLYEKRRRNIAVAAPWKWTLYDHSWISLERDLFSKDEFRKHKIPNARGQPWGFHYFIGIGLDGSVQALPMHMNRAQPLKNGAVVHHQNFVIPPGLFDLAGKKGVHDYAAMMFAVVRNFCAAALSGAQLSVRRGDEVVRLGVPLSNVKGFFRDRDREGRRRPSLLHYVGEYQYDRQGRTVTVGEHLRGARRFSWRDYDITISAPGIHAPSPEAFAVEPMMDDDILPIPGKTIPVSKVAGMMQRAIESERRVPFRRGVPTSTYHTHTLEEARRA